MWRVYLFAAEKKLALWGHRDRHRTQLTPKSPHPGLFDDLEANHAGAEIAFCFVGAHPYIGDRKRA